MTGAGLAQTHSLAGFFDAAAVRETGALIPVTTTERLFVRG
jgi:hypothetical protein